MNRTVDLVIAGGTSGAVAAALEAKGNGLRVLIVCRELDVPVGRVRGAGTISVISGVEPVCVDGVGAPEAVVLRELKSGKLIGVNTSRLLRFPEPGSATATALRAARPRTPASRSAESRRRVSRAPRSPSRVES